MKILLAHSDHKLPARESIDLWRIIRPFRELQKHVDWQIDSVPYLIPEELLGKDNKVETDKLVEHMLSLKEYDVIWTSYFPDAVLFDVMDFMYHKFGTKFVLDCDDDMFHIPADNSVWKSAGTKGIEAMQWMITEAPFVVTSSEVLKAEFESRRQNPTYLLPNYIGDDYSHKPFDNGDKVVISFFGSITHKRDMHETGFIEALQQILDKYKQVHVGSVGLDLTPYLPKDRASFHYGKPGQAYLDEVWPNINADIAVAPLIDDAFNRGRSNIKWLEATMIPAAFVGSNIPPYKGTVKHGKTGLLTENTSEDWFEALEQLVFSKDLRDKLILNATKEVRSKWHIAKQWITLKDIIETISKH